jgi:Ca2+-binding EF-hand superfamily protein
MMKTLAPLVGSLLLALPVLAQTPTGSGTPAGDAGFTERFRQADTNGDGSLSEEEARKANFEFSRDFNSVDRDHNGLVTLFELGEALQAHIGNWTSADANHDGKVTEEEARKGAPSLASIFFRADMNGDRVVDREEYETYTRRQLYDNVDLPYVVPNIIDKRF